LIDELGIDVPSYHKYADEDLYRSLGLKRGFFSIRKPSEPTN